MIEKNDHMSDETQRAALRDETHVFVVQECEKNSNTLYVFASEDIAESFILRKIAEFKENFITSSHRLDIVLVNEYTYMIKTKTWYFGFIYFESIQKIFTIEKKEVRY